MIGALTDSFSINGIKGSDYLIDLISATL